ncbi:hypothetical protein, partial [Mesorhizobium sp. M1A.F.Ca.IN.020.06.1.1]|uniref:hypothetical protein n=1 Tax=Mesorhizobium sp. M1A.F.Ca.IN.020.06.1.1 TaxID=2496765 RepID=UPI0019D46DFA
MRVSGASAVSIAAVMHDRGDAAEQRLLVDIADGEPIVPVVGKAKLGPATRDHRAPALGADRLDGRTAGLLGHGNGAEAD